jgi:dihydrofolate synthase/folylpolyglutamate synthase
MVVETGMGGRHDSTNVLNPLVSVITMIELEHIDYLGNTISAIAGEKAGIIKYGKPLVLAQQSEEALEVIRRKAQEHNSPVFYLPEIVELSNVRISPQGSCFSLVINSKNSQENILDEIQDDYFIPIPGKVQAQNAALAIVAVKTAFPQIKKEAVYNGLNSFHIPARFEKISDKPVFIIDGAHTPESLGLCIETFCSLYGEGGVLLFGCAADKDAAKMAKITHSYFSKIIITTPGTFKISNPVQVYEAFTSYTGQEKTVLIKNTQEAVKQAVEFALEKNLPVLGAGSFYLVSEIRKSYESNT